ncbi:hypothetical protein HK102_006007, partial [Quaeritorhiza haematococci]
ALHEMHRYAIKHETVPPIGWKILIGITIGMGAFHVFRAYSTLTTAAAISTSSSPISSPSSTIEFTLTSPPLS